MNMNDTSVRVGEIQLWSKSLIMTSKEAPADAEAASHRLLTRAGCIRRVAAGVYTYLPLGWRVLRRIQAIVREEMNAAGASELLMPALAPTELLRETGRAEAYGDLLFRFEDRHGRDSYLGPTHEEVITDLMRATITSYRQLPLNLYQIQSKYRDEYRPRAGLLRGREFIMKDAYSFSMTLEGPGGLNEMYDLMYQAYTNIFTRCGLDFSAVEAEAGPIGGSASHEFMVNAPAGEDKIMSCPESGYAANVEKCEIGHRDHNFDGPPTGDLEEVHTPECTTIEAVSKFMKVKPRNMLKNVVFQVQDEESPVRWIVAVVRADHDANEGKVRDAAGVPIGIAEDGAAMKGAGFAVGYISPRATIGRSDILLLVDPDAAQGMGPDGTKGMFWATGADKDEHHVKHFNWVREMGDALKDVRVVDIRNAEAGDPSPRVEGVALEERRGIEVGHIFKLGCKYSDAMGFRVLDENQQQQSVIMGCYGIGVSRTMAACVEMSHDDDGIIWPAAIAPYDVLITPLKVEDDAETMVVARDLATKLALAGLDVLVDDRNERPGFKFKDADLIGIPVRITVGDKGLAEGSVELKRRGEEGKGSLVKVEEVGAVLGIQD